jgi:hypothetical protein
VCELRSYIGGIAVLEHRGQGRGSCLAQSCEVLESDWRWWVAIHGILLGEVLQECSFEHTVFGDKGLFQLLPINLWQSLLLLFLTLVDFPRLTDKAEG